MRRSLKSAPLSGCWRTKIASYAAAAIDLVLVLAAAAAAAAANLAAGWS
jgi:hypothetical protein